MLRRSKHVEECRFRHRNAEQKFQQAKLRTRVPRTRQAENRIGCTATTMHIERKSFGRQATMFLHAPLEHIPQSRVSNANAILWHQKQLHQALRQHADREVKGHSVVLGSACPVFVDRCS